jgi:hypothetical protein
MRGMEPKARYTTFGWLAGVALVLTALIWSILPWWKAVPFTLAALALVGMALPIFRPVRRRISLCFITFGLFATTCSWMAIQSDPLVWICEWAFKLTGQAPLPFVPPSSIYTTQYVVFAFAFIAFLASLWWARDDTAMGVHPLPIERANPGREFTERITTFCSRLKVNLDKLDEETNWSDALFVPLEAEVEVRSAHRRNRRIAPLIPALKENFEHRFLLVLGDPGSGKSVALRKLSRDLLDETSETGRIPVYINLRDWDTPRNWHIENPPQVHEVEVNLRDWIFLNLKNRLDIYARQFLDLHFDTLIEQGRFFFILDSFDEIALLLGVDERHSIIARFSEAIGHFLGGMHHSRGILASRLFRRPTSEFGAPCQLEIRPLSEERFAQLARKRFMEVGMTHRVMAERPDLADSARNPFFAALLVQYLTNAARSKTQIKLPESRSEVFADHIQTRLLACRDVLRRPDLPIEEMVSALEKLSTAMFHTRGGFELPIGDLPELTLFVDNAQMIRALEQARLVRLGQGIDPHISFTHRRFAEYLAAQKLLLNPAPLPLDDIPTDSLWRDTLVLYCEIAPPAEAAAVASYCWSQIELLRHNPVSQDAAAWLRELHCLRFLAEAFRTHPEAILRFRDDLYKHVLRQAMEGDVLSAKWALETAGLFSAEQSTELLHTALKRENPWLAETALRACRFLRHLERALYWRFVGAIWNKPYLDLWAQRRDLDVALSVNPKLRPVRFFFWSVLVDSWIWGITIAVIPVIACGIIANAGTLDWFSTSVSLYWLFFFSVFLVTAGACPSWWLALVDFRKMRGLTLLYRSLGPYVLYKSGSGIGVMHSLMFPIAFIPWAGPLLFRGICGFRWPRFNRARVVLIVRLTGLIVVVFALAVVALKSIEYCIERAREEITTLGKILWLLWPGSIVIGVGAAFAINAFRFFRSALSDFFHLRRATVFPKVMTRAWIASMLGPLVLLSSRRLFVERLAVVQRIEGEWPVGPPYTQNDWASAELARLDEKWRGLDR